MNIERIFRRYGRKISAVDDNGNVVCSAECFVQPLRYKNKMYLEGTPTEIGLNESGYYLFLAPAGYSIENAADNGYLTDGNNEYHIDRYEDIYVGEKIYFRWAIIRLCFPDTYPAYNHFT